MKKQSKTYFLIYFIQNRNTNNSKRNLTLIKISMQVKAVSE
jgi:hypothetical protein